jgi:O-antigen/teichoic acid export membrane protein
MVGMSSAPKQRREGSAFISLFTQIPTSWRFFGRATAAFTMVNFGTKALSFLLLVPVYSRFLSPEEFGVVFLSEAMAIVVATVYASTFETSIQRFYYRHSDPSRRRACISTIVKIGMLLIGGICFLAFIFGPLVLRHALPHFGVPFYPYLALAIGTFALNQIILYRLAIYQAEQQTFRFVVLSLVLFVAASVGSLIFVVSFHAGALGMLAGKFIPTAIVAVGAMFLLRGWMMFGWDQETLKEFTKFTLPMFAYPFIVLGLNVADRLILQRYRSMREVGIYSLAYGIGMGMSLLVLSLHQTWIPAFYKTAARGDAHKSRNARLVTSALLVKLTFAIVGVSLSPLFIVRVLDSRYREGATLVPIIICGYLLRGFTFSFHVPLMTAGKTLAASLSGGIALAVNLAINFAFIPSHGIYAAAAATAIAYGVEMAIVYLLAQRVYPLRYARRKLGLGMLLLTLTLIISQSSVRTNLAVVAVAMTAALACVLYMLWDVACRSEPVNPP